MGSWSSLLQVNTAYTLHKLKEILHVYLVPAQRWFCCSQCFLLIPHILQETSRNSSQSKTVFSYSTILSEDPVTYLHIALSSHRSGVCEQASRRTGFAHFSEILMWSLGQFAVSVNTPCLKSGVKQIPAQDMKSMNPHRQKLNREQLKGNSHCLNVNVLCS